ncbi:hypothetical protein BCR36DRAFT_581895 [Piromyces finnis]|uniref:Uncharacterized protein n=1 Tax=Piromyces finnis TaxID=1754191 RepID=A0A1Y1VFK5_9FUNG|nr:hypothetical protein BCR36DRAFT_581895 [Piromyces finnis]|eukprot:ORX54273.1 hypothetical protein BCR36DRAFT_581895 [Piromyces finnis]
MASENDLPVLKEIKCCEEVMYKPELYDESKHLSRPFSSPMSKRTIKNRDLISKTKENISHSNLIEKEVEGLNPIEAFKQKLMFNTLQTERKRNPKLPKSVQIEIKKQYLYNKYKDYDPLKEENVLKNVLINEKKERKKYFNIKSDIIYDPNAQYMINFNNNDIETDNILDYIHRKKKEHKKLNIQENYMYKSDVDIIRNKINRDGTSYNGNFGIAGKEYVGADKQVEELCKKRNYISPPEKYVQYHKYLEESNDKESFSFHNNEDVKDIDINNQDKNNNINDNKENKNIKKSKNDDKTNRMINSNIKKKRNSNQKKSKIGQSTSARTYYGSNSGYNALSRPALPTSLVKRHNAHRNLERFNIEQVVLRRLRYILNFNEIEKDHIYLIDFLKESNIPNDLFHLLFQNNFNSLDDLRNELLGQMLNENINKVKKKNIKDNSTNIYENKNNNEDMKKININNKCENEYNNEEKQNENENDLYSEKSINIEENYCNISNESLKLSDLNLKYRKIKGMQPKTSQKIKMNPKRKEPTTPKELLYIIDNYKNMSQKFYNDYNQYNVKRSSNNEDVLSVNNSKINTKLDKNINSISKAKNQGLSYQEIIKALQK